MKQLISIGLSGALILGVGCNRTIAPQERTALVEKLAQKQRQSIESIIQLDVRRVNINRTVFDGLPEPLMAKNIAEAFEKSHPDFKVLRKINLVKTDKEFYMDILVEQRKS